MEFIYTLKLDSGKYYVGKTNNVHRRMFEHVNGGGSRWVNMYAPNKLINISFLIDKYSEDLTTLVSMWLYGIDNVRGGRYNKPNLSDKHFNEINTFLYKFDDYLRSLTDNEYHLDIFVYLWKTNFEWDYLDKEDLEMLRDLDEQIHEIYFSCRNFN